MTSEAYAWIFLPNARTPVVCGRLFETADGGISFVYGRSYRSRDDAIPLAPEGFGLGPAVIAGRREGALPGPLRDAAPDAWARFAITYQRGNDRLGELDLLLSGRGDRIGALEFSASPTELKLGESDETTLKEMEAAARGAQEGGKMPRHLLDALRHGTTIGGARPKATLKMDGGHWIAKFSSTTDTARVVRWEAATLELAERAGIDVPERRLVRINRRDALLVKRFDRAPVDGGYSRRMMLSALTLLNLDETEARLASYPDFSEVLLKHSRDAKNDRQQLFRRLVFNILIGNEDDHAKNHACFWDGRWLDLTPAYDMVPQRRVGLEGRQAMTVGDQGPESTLANALSSAGRFGLAARSARSIADEVHDVIRSRWQATFQRHGVPEPEVEALRERAVLSPVALGKR